MFVDDESEETTSTGLTTRTLEAQVIERSAQIRNLPTEHEAVREPTEEHEDLYRYIVELNALIPWTTDPMGQVQTMGMSWFGTTGLTFEETQGDGWSRALHPEDRQWILSLWYRTTKESGKLSADFRVRLTDGTYRWHRALAAPRFGSDGRVIRYYGTMTDIDEQKQASDGLQHVQAELIHASRLSAMDAMASTLAHELNQPLTAIANYMRGCVRLLANVEGSAVPMIVEALTEADQNAVRAGEITRRLRETVRRGSLEKISEDLPRLIAEACKIALDDELASGIRCRLDQATELRTVFVDRIQIQQVLINLLRNAVEALRNIHDREIVIATHVLSKQFCEVVVRDNGPGLAPEVKERLFSTFNSTKEDGMGIGLSISRTIIEAHGGDIWAEDFPDGGTAFHFTLPCGR
jgi:two-component system sensor kinase FixL